MTAVLTLRGTNRHDPRIDAWLDEHPGALGALARESVYMIRQIAVGGTEVMHDGAATICINDAPFVYVGIYKAHVSIGFFQGAELPDPHKLLQGDGKRMRHLKLRPDGQTEAPLVIALVQAAYDDMKQRTSPPAG